MRKVKQRVLSMLLVAAMVITMLPMVAVAANTEEDLGFTATDTSGNYVDLKLMAATSLYTGSGEQITKDSTGTVKLTNILTLYQGNRVQAGYDYTSLGGSLEVEEDMTTIKVNDANTAIMDQYAAIANGLFKDETNLGEKALKVRPGQTMYLAIGLEGHFGGASPMKGLTAATLNLLANTAVFTVGARGSMVVNHLLGGGTTLGSFALSSLKDVYPDYAGNYEVKNANSSTTYGESTGFGLVVGTNDDYYMSPKSTWSVLVPITVSESAAPGTYYINPINDTTGNNIAIAWSNLESGTLGIASSKEGAGKGKNTLSANSVKIEVINPSDPLAGTTADYSADGVVENEKNGFFAEGTTGVKTEDLFIVPTITSPAENTHVLAENDTIIFYANEVNAEDSTEKCGTELGRAPIQKDTAGTVTGTANALYADLKTVVTPEGGTPTTDYFIPQAGGKLWIDVIQAPVTSGDTTTTYTESGEPIQITVPAEKKYYSGDTTEYPVYATGAGSESEPVEVPLGSSVQDVLDKLSSKPAVLTNVALDYGDPVTVSLDWTEIDYEATAVASAETTAAGFTTYDATAKLRIPFPTEAEGGFAQGGKGGSTEYCAVVYATVLPIAGDYTVKKTESGTGTLTIKADSLTATSIGTGDKVTVYDSETAASGTDVALTNGTAEYDLTGVTLPNVGESIYLSYTAKDMTETKKVAVTVLDSTAKPEVSGDVDLTAGTDGFTVETGTTLTDLLAQTDDEGNGIFTGIKVPVSGDLTATVSVTETDVTFFSNEGYTTPATYTDVNSTHQGTLYMKYVIPTTGKTDPAEGETEGVDFANSKGYAIKAKITFLTKIKPQASDVHATNNAYPASDTVTFTQAASGAEAVQTSDTVKFYSDVACTKEIAVSESISINGGTAVTVTVPQLGYSAGTVYMVIGGRSAVFDSDPIAVTVDNAEPYTITKITGGSDTTLKFQATMDEAGENEVTTWNEIYNQLPTSATVTYGRFKKSDSANTAVLDSATTGTKTVNFTPWTAGGKNWVLHNGNDVNDNNVRNMADELSIKAQIDVASLTTDDGTPIAKVNNSEIVTPADVPTEFTMKFLVTSAKQDDGAEEGKLARLSFTNNAYPKKDQVNIDNAATDPVTATLVVGDVIRLWTADPKTEGSGAVEKASHTLTADDLTNGYFEIEQLGAKKGSLYATVETATAAATISKAISRDEEPWVIYSYSVTPNTLSVTAGTPLADLTGTKLPQTANVTVAHLMTSGGKLQTEFTAATTASLNTNGWTVKVDESTSEALAQSHLNNKTTTPLTLTAAVDDSALTGLTVQDVAVEKCASLTLTMPTLALTVNDMPTLNVPTFGNTAADANHIVVTNEKKNDNDEIEIGTDTADTDFQTLIGDTGLTVELTYLDEHGNEQTISPVDLSTNPLTINKDTEGFTGLTPADANGGVTLTFSKDGFNSVTVKTDIAAEPAVTIIGSVDAGLKLHLLAGAVSSETELLGYVNGITLSAKDDANVAISSSDVTLSVDTTTWALKNSSNAAVTDVAAALNTPDTYKLTATVKLPVGETSFELSDAAKTVEIPVTVADMDGVGVTLAEGNNDLYLHGSDAGTPAAAKLAALQAEDNSVTKEDFKNSLVFWYRYENHDTDIAPWANGSKLAAIGTDTIGSEAGKTYASIDAWKAAAPTGTTRNVEVSEVNVDGTAINKTITLSDSSTVTLDKIQPQHVEAQSDGSDAKEYFTPNTTGGVRRSEELYKIVYKVTDGEDVYVVTYDVKLRYKAGDANLDGSINVLDAGYANQYSINLAYPFLDAAGNKMEALCLSVLDLNEDKSGNVLDAGAMNQLSINLITYPYCRY